MRHRYRHRTVPGDGTKTFDDIGRELGVTKQRVKQIYDGALRKLRRIVAEDPSLATVMKELLAEDTPNRQWRRRKEPTES